MASALFTSEEFPKPLPNGLTGIPFQPALSPDYQVPMRFALRLHGDAEAEYQLRLQVLGTIFTVALKEPPSLDPARRIAARRIPDPAPGGLDSELRLSDGKAAMPVDVGFFRPISSGHAFDLPETVEQIKNGDFRFLLTGISIKGGWRLRHVDGEMWELSKEADEFASEREGLVLDRSIKSGRTLDEID